MPKIVPASLPMDLSEGDDESQAEDTAMDDSISEETQNSENPEPGDEEQSGEAEEQSEEDEEQSEEDEEGVDQSIADSTAADNESGSMEEESMDVIPETREIFAATPRLPASTRPPQVKSGKNIKMTEMPKQQAKTKVKKRAPAPGMAASEAGPSAKKRKKMSANSSSVYTRSIYKVFREVCDSKFTMSSKSMSLMNSFCIDMFERFASEAGRLCAMNGNKTMGVREMETAVKLVLGAGSELSRHAISEGAKALVAYERSREDSRRRPTADVVKNKVSAPTGKPKKKEDAGKKLATDVPNKKQPNEAGKKKSPMVGPEPKKTVNDAGKKKK